jgi:hypothetical protein
MGWLGGIGAGLQSFGGDLEDLLAKRKAEEMKKQEIARQQAQQIIENKRHQEELDLQKRDQDIRNQQFGETQKANTLSELQYTDPTQPLNSDMVNKVNRVGLGGMLKTVGPGQTRLPSTQQVGIGTEGSKRGDVNQNVMNAPKTDVGQVEGVYRPQSPAEQKQIRDEEWRTKESNDAQNEKFFSQGRALQNAKEIAAERVAGENQRAADSNDLKRFLGGVLTTTKQQHADDVHQQFLDKKDTATKDEAQKHQRVIDEAQGIKDMATSLKAHPGFSHLFGFMNSRTPDVQGDTMDAAAKLDQLKASVSLENLNRWRSEAKNGSSGFGRLTQYEFIAFEKAVGRLQRAQSLAGAQQSMDDIAGIMDKVIQKNQSSSNPKIRRYDMNGNPIQ